MVICINKKIENIFGVCVKLQKRQWKIGRTIKYCGNTRHRQVLPQLFQVLRNFCECFYDLEETQKNCVLFLLENTARKRMENHFGYFDYQNIESHHLYHHCISIPLIDTLDRHLDQYLSDFLIAVWSSPAQHLISRRFIVGPVSTVSYTIINRKLVDCQLRC